MIGVSRQGLRGTESLAFHGGDEEQVASHRVHFARHGWTRLANFLDGALVQEIATALDDAAFQPDEHKDIGRDERMENRAIDGLLHFAVNDPRLFKLVERITGCSAIGSFRGRVYRLAAGGGNHLTWHNDLYDNTRLVAMSLNLGLEPYAGGVLQIRESLTEEIREEVENRGSGDAIVFRLARELEHRVTPVEGPISRTAFAGWFCSSPDFASTVKAPRAAAI
jgi:hypothetical protein